MDIEQQKSKVFVTGAAGFVGGHVCRALVEAGHEVAGMARTLPGEGEERVPGVTYVTGDVTRPATLTPEKLAGCAAVVHLVGIIAEARDRGQTFEAVHVAGTNNVLTAARAAGFTGRFLYLSAIGSEPDAPAEYSRTKARAEQAVRDSGLPFTILRPSIIVGPGCEFLEQMEGLIRRPPLSPVALPFVPVPGNGRNRFQPVYIADLTTALIRCLDETRDGNSGLNETLCLGGADEVTFDELIDAVARQIGLQKPLLHAPMPLMFAAASVLESLLPRPPITTDQLLNLKRHNICDNTAIRAALGINPLSFAEALAKTYAGQDTNKRRRPDA